jgi:hypothetical protein
MTAPAPNVNNTEEWWSINGVSLHQYGWSVTTVGGSRYDLPPRRGSNQMIAYRPGQVLRKKLPDSRPITLLMFMVGFPAGAESAQRLLEDFDQRTQWNDNWDFLRRLVWEPYIGADGLIQLTRRWRLTAPKFPTSRSSSDPSCIVGDPGVPASGVSRIVAATANAENTGTMAPNMTGRFRSDFQFDLNLPDPYFYSSSAVTATLNPGQTVWVWNDGHDVAAHSFVTVRFVGPLTNPSLRNHMFDPVNSITYKGTIPMGKTVSLNVGAYRATVHDTGESSAQTPTNNRIRYVQASGAQWWFNVMPKSNRLSCTATSGSGHVELTYRHPYV